MCQGNYLSVQYYGENRLLQITHISTLESKESILSPQTRNGPRALSPLKEDAVISKLLNLSLSPEPVEVSPEEKQRPLVGTAVQCPPEEKERPLVGTAMQCPPIVIHKITSKTKINLRRRKGPACTIVEVCIIIIVLLCCSSYYCCPFFINWVCHLINGFKVVYIVDWCILILQPDGPKLSSFAGAEKQVELLKELVLYPLRETNNRQGESVCMHH